jgi:hypothetical protein
MLSPQPELIWEGRIHLGDEPGIYGDASYSGLATELPFTLYRGKSATTQQVDLTIDAEHVTNFTPYPGHEVEIWWYEDDGTGKHHWKQTQILSARLTTNALTITLQLPSTATPAYLSCSIRVDTTVAAGLYNDFSIRRLSITSTNYDYTAAFGFQND